MTRRRTQRQRPTRDAERAAELADVFRDLVDDVGRELLELAEQRRARRRARARRARMRVAESERGPVRRDRSA